MSADDRVRYWRDRALKAEHRTTWAEEEHEHLLSWFSQRISDERRLRDRCTYLYGLAMTLGATPDQLAGPETPGDHDQCDETCQAKKIERAIRAAVDRGEQ